ncbi:MAG: choice-of-anchor D domain-containing protein [Blastocatellia bacterium]
MMHLLDWARAQGRTQEVIDLGMALDAPLTLTGQWDRWKETIEAVREAALARDDRGRAAWALHQLGTRALCQDAESEARRLLSQALAERQAIGDDMAVRVTQHNLRDPIRLVPEAESTGDDEDRRWLRRLAPLAGALLLLEGMLYASLDKITNWLWPEVTTVTLNPGALEFANQAPGTVSEPRRVQVGNPGQRELTLAPLSAAGGNAAHFEVTENNCGAPLPPRGACAFAVRYAPRAPGRHDAAIVIRNQNGQTLGTLRLQGGAVETSLHTPPPSPPPTGPPPSPPIAAPSTPAAPVPAPRLAIDTSALTFGSVAVGEAVTRQARVNNAGNAPLTIRAADITDSEAFRIADNGCGPGPLAPGRGCVITIEFRPREAGARTARLRLTGHDTGCPRFVALSGSGATQPRLSFSPPALRFSGQVNSRRLSALSLTISNQGTGPLTISDIGLREQVHFLLAGQGCMGATLAPGQSCEVRVQFQPKTPGNLNDQLRITSNDAGSPHLIAVTGTASAPPTATPTPRLNVTPPRLSFSVSQSGRVSQTRGTVTVSNTGGGALEQLQATLEGADAAWFSASSGCANARLGPGQSCAIDVQFRIPPLSRINRPGLTATLRIGASGVSPRTVTLYAALDAAPPPPSVEISTRELDFGEAPVGQGNRLLSVRVRNTGAAPLTPGEPHIVGAGRGGIATMRMQSPFRVLRTSCTGQIAPGQACAISVQYAPVSAGRHAGMLLMSVAGSDQTVSLRGVATDPTPSAPPPPPAQKVFCCLPDGAVAELTKEQCAALIIVSAIVSNAPAGAHDCLHLSGMAETMIKAEG